MKPSRYSCSKAVAAALLLVAATTTLGFNDPVSAPAMKSELVLRSPLLATVSIGNRIVGVGQRGHVVVSEDGGKTWIQGNVPLSNDLVAVSFPSPMQGWAVGHGGVVIHTEDGGRTWSRQLDGKQAYDLVLNYYGERAKKGDAAAAAQVEKDNNLIGYGGTQPFMDVYFENDQVGYIVGTFNRIFQTTDGGKTWTPIMDRIDNPGDLHLYSIRSGASGVYLTGEQGKVWRLDPATKHFVVRPTPYDGTLFGSVFAADGSIIAFGMRGTVFRSDDQGATWTRVEIGSKAGIAAGTRMANGEILLANLAGVAMVSKDGGKSFQPIKMSRPMPYFGAATLGDKQLAVVGAEGVRIETVN